MWFSVLNHINYSVRILEYGKTPETFIPKNSEKSDSQNSRSVNKHPKSQIDLEFSESPLFSQFCSVRIPHIGLHLEILRLRPGTSLY